MHNRKWAKSFRFTAMLIKIEWAGCKPDGFSGGKIEKNGINQKNQFSSS